MPRLALTFLVAMLASPTLAAGKVLVLGEVKVLAMLRANPVVQAAVAQGRRFFGARACRTAVKTTQPPEFEPGTTFDYDATITCDGHESDAVITVTGRLLSEGPQALKLSLDFAG